MPGQRSNQSKRSERERSGAGAREQSQSFRDIAGEMPAVADPQRKARAAESFKAFCETYLAEIFALDWSDDHLRALDYLQTAVRDGGLFAYAMPRGSGKTTLAEAASLWALLFGYRQFVVLIGSDEGSACELLDSIKTQLETNDLLLADFPEACYPIRCLDGIAQRANGQLVDGVRTHIGWGAKEVVLPTIAGSPASGGILRVAGITGRIRGLKFVRPGDGKSVRPDLVIPDDPQTDESARSPSQSAQRVRILCGAILGLAGPGRKIAGVMPCTVITPGDMADEILDRQRHPEWQGERTKLVYAWGERTDLWDRYREIRSAGLRSGDGGKEATEFYRRNRAAMDAGSHVAWPARHDPDELSALQHAVNLEMDRGKAAFAAEFQNEPLAENAGDEEKLTADQVAQKLNGFGRGEIPTEANRIVCFIDVQKPLFYWGVCAFADDFTGWVIDYGVWPEQPRKYFHRRDVKKTTAVVLKSKSLEETIYQGLVRLTGELLTREWTRNDGAQLRIEKCCIDEGWGESTDVIRQFARESPHAAVIVPTKGQYFGAKSTRGINDGKPKPGEERGDHWRRPPVAGKRAVRSALFDSNYYKSFTHARLSTPIGGRGCLSIFGDDPEEHRMFAEHATAENPTVVEAKGRRVTEWQLPPSKPDNDFLDVMSGCCVAASMLRVVLAERGIDAPKKVRRIKLSELQNQKRAQRRTP